MDGAPVTATEIDEKYKRWVNAIREAEDKMVLDNLEYLKKVMEQIVNEPARTRPGSNEQAPVEKI